MKTNQRRKTIIVPVGDVLLGGTNPVAIQSMVLAPPHEFKDAINQIACLTEAGCDIVRIAVPTLEDASYLGTIKKATKIPLVADIHFDPLLALSAIQQGIDKIRLNPSNIRDSEMIKKVVLAAKNREIPIRIGANSGSLRRHKNVKDAVSQLLKAIQGEIDLLIQYDFTRIVISAKSSSLEINDAINRKLSQEYDFPIHLGITEAGTLVPGIVKSTLGLAPLLQSGIGDTIRISLSGELASEILAARTLLQELGLRQGVKLISCPMCGRAKWNVAEVADQILKQTSEIHRDVTVAIMGCEVNGPGEARDADIGLAGSGQYIVLFEKGQIVDKGAAQQMVRELKKRLGGNKWT